MKRHLLLGVGLMVGLGLLALRVAAQERAGGAGKAGQVDSGMSPEEKKRWEKLLPGDVRQKQSALDQIQSQHEIRSEVERNPSTISPIIARHYRDLTASAGDPQEFQSRIASFRHAVETAESSGILIPIEQANEVAFLFMAQLGRPEGNHIAGRGFLLEFIARHSKSDATRAFINKKLHETGEDRNRIVNGLYHTESFKGDEKLAGSLVSRYKLSNPRDVGLLGLVARINPDMAIPILTQEINGAKTIKQFNALASIACMTRKNEALDLVLDRVFDFPPAPAGSDQSPTLGIYAEQLLDYVRQAENERLIRALKVLAMTGTARARSREVLVGKLDSENAATRAAAYGYFETMFKAGDFVDAALFAELQRRAQQERSEKVRKSADAALLILKKKINP